MNRIVISIPLAIEPLERGDRFDLPLCDLFDKTDGGDVVGGGTMLHRGSVEGAEIELEVEDLKLLSKIAKVLEAGDAPRDTTIQVGAPTCRTLLLGDLLDGNDALGSEKAPG